MNLFKIIFSLGIIFHSVFILGQNYNMSDGTTITTCSGNFYDSGGSTGDYSSNETFTFTICPDTPGSLVEVDFTSFELENNYDDLTIYDGDNTGATTLGTYTGNTGPGFVSATNGNTSGCLTFVFDSDGSVTDLGWEALISCSEPCQTINSQLDNTNPVADGDDVIRICQGESITFNGSGTFSDSGAGATYEWDLGDGNTANGTSTSYTYNTPGAYLVNLNIEDADGCINDNLINQVVQVSSTPIFDGTVAAETEICLGETNTLTGVVTPVEVIKECTPPVSGQTFLPDGSGVSYETSVTVDCFDPSETITDPNDIEDICIDMEHSYIGDLEIVIICPNGQEMLIMDYPNGGGGTFLGNPWDGAQQANGAGDGLTYCFDNINNNGTLVNGPTQAATNTAGNTILPGTYEPVGTFNDLVGCPLNGDWTIEVTDNLGSDDGYVFEWGLNFDGTIIPGDFSFTPTIDNEQWQADPTITNVNGNDITVEPTSAGTSCYTYEMTDNFGCTFDTTICFDVLPAPVIDPIADVSQCTPYTLPAITGIDLTGNEAYYTGTGGTGTQYSPGDVISTTTTIYIYDEMAVSPFCADEESFLVEIINSVLTLNCPPDDNAVCDISEVPPFGNFNDFENAGGSANSTDANVLEGTFTLESEVSDNSTCPETIVRTYSIEDDCGNYETCTQSIVVDDNINPTGTAPADVAVQCIGDIPAVNINDVTGVSDNCGIPTVTHVGDVSDNGTCPEIITRTYRIEDDCG
ncbi:MAG: PKD domain-containing protein, partial [Brumimicrobium sp.]